MLQFQLCLRATQSVHTGQWAELLPSYDSPGSLATPSMQLVSPCWPHAVQVGKITWDLETTMPTLQANAHTFMFAMPGTQCFYSVLLASSEPHAALQSCYAWQSAFPLSPSLVSNEPVAPRLDICYDQLSVHLLLLVFSQARLWKPPSCSPAFSGSAPHTR